MTRPVAAVPPHPLPPHRDRRRPPAGPSPHSPGEREPAGRLRAPGTGRSLRPVRRGGGGHGAGRRPPPAPPAPGGSAVRGAGRPSGRSPRGRLLRWDSAWGGAGLGGLWGCTGKGRCTKMGGGTQPGRGMRSISRPGLMDALRSKGLRDAPGGGMYQQGVRGVRVRWRVRLQEHRERDPSFCLAGGGWGSSAGVGTPGGRGRHHTVDLRAQRLLFPAAHHVGTPEIALIRGR